jgi:hypothetical protein
VAGFDATAGSIATTPSSSLVPPGIPTISVLSMPVPSVDTPWVVPVGTKKFSVKLRSTAVLKVATSAGDIALGTYYSAEFGNEYEESGILVSGSLTFYFQCDIINTLEIKTWS